MLRRLAPGSRVIHEGSLVDELAEIIRSDISIDVTGDATEVLPHLTRVLASDYFAPRGSYAILKGERHEFGTAEGVAIRLSPGLPIDATYQGVAAHIGFIQSLDRIHDLLRGHGAVQSWMLRETRSSAYLYGQSARWMEEVGLAVLSKDFPESVISVDRIA
ncbi:hypothetical protein [Microbacterium allomyrinae]|uniref:Uncharacterized protein n=1 Tax=Microbacterium allomyrinae TaxID=2830666 RepID=A0A9X1LWF7_9MICO|nr:hypothetical protein [Microbacterium allomyrinae]MCC2032690.1 hypothetical protein [Microbacterium allomyrinae]